MTLAEAIDTTRLHRAAGLTGARPELVTACPFRLHVLEVLRQPLEGPLDRHAVRGAKSAGARATATVHDRSV